MATLEQASFSVANQQALVAPAQGGASGQWLQVLPHLDPKYGGLSAVVPRLASQLLTQEHMQVHVAAFCAPEEERFAEGRQGLSLWPLSRSVWASNPKLKPAFEADVAHSSGVHIHGLWEGSTQLAAAAARKAGIPYIVSAHGMLDPWALANKRWKKLAYSALFEWKNVRGAACLHALTKAEASDYRRFGCKGPIAVIPNGVEADKNADPTYFLDTYPQAQGRKVVLFLGRIHFKKGVDLLVKAWSEIADQHPAALLVLAGPDSEETLSKIQETVGRANLQDRVLFTGMLDAPMKWSALAAATCFVLPSYSEGLSVAVLEALSMGVPVILSAECHLPQVAEHGAGWLVQTTTESVAQALEIALASSAEERGQIGQRARDLAEREFSWSSVASRMAEVYRWINGGSVPAKVEILQAGA